MAMESVTLSVKGMSCEHCVKAVKRALDGLFGVNNVDVSLNEGKAFVDFDKEKITLAEIKNAIADEGYEVE
ncbi:MAG: copper ion binding protein [Eubacteriales bacterium]|jgi:copper chaperone|nr:copper ion binding protein [Eubacteriales bacterium]